MVALLIMQDNNEIMFECKYRKSIRANIRADKIEV